LLVTAVDDLLGPDVRLIVEVSPPVDVVAHPRHPYTAALLSVASRSGPSDHLLLAGETPSPVAVAPVCLFHLRSPLYRELGGPLVCRTSDPLLEPAEHASPTGATAFGHEHGRHVDQGAH